MEVIIQQNFYALATRVCGMARCSGMLLKYLLKAGLKTAFASNSDAITNGPADDGFFTPVPIVLNENYTGHEHILKPAIKKSILDILTSSTIYSKHLSYMRPFLIIPRKKNTKCSIFTGSN